MTTHKVSWLESLLVGLLVFGVIATGSSLALLAGLVAYIRTDESLWSSLGPHVALSAVAAASVSGALAWRFVVRTDEGQRWSGAVAGLVVGIVAHPLCWMFYSASSLVLDRSRFSGVNPVVFVLFTTTLATLPSLFGLGWLSAPLCALLGFITADVRSAIHRRAMRGGVPDKGL